jgi:two-component system, OmpR family, sensor kinase
MSRSRTSRTRTSSRLLPVPLRLKVMAGVVVVTLAALTAFDVGVSITMRRYLLAQTDDNLQVAMPLAEPMLSSLDYAGVAHLPAHPPRGIGARRAPRPGSAESAVLPGGFDIAFVPFHGPAVLFELSTTPVIRRRSFLAPAFIPKLVAQPGLHTVSVGRSGLVFRVLSARVKGGSLVVGTSLSQVITTANQVELIVALGSVAVVLLIGLGVFAVVRRGLRPIEAMARQADRITGGDLTDRVATHNPRTEVGRLGAALNGMLARIETSQQQMRRFFADASHELRTPLASLRANAQLYQQGAVQDPDEVDEVMDRIVLETRRMGRLVDDMLRLARLGQHPGQSREPVDVTAVVTGCAERARIAGPARAWQARISEGLTVTGDQELLRRAIDNMIMNVLVHTPADSVGSITAAARGDRVIIEVSDDGPGVTPDHLPHIFERFYRAGTRPGPSGSGLGLAIAAEVASAHGGTAQAAPVQPHGLRVTLCLPVRPVRAGSRSASGLAATAGQATGPVTVTSVP